jgi:hypothetical protein
LRRRGQLRCGGEDPGPELDREVLQVLLDHVRRARRPADFSATTLSSQSRMEKEQTYSPSVSTMLTLRPGAAWIE